MSIHDHFPLRHDACMVTDDDLHWFNEGTHLHLYDKLGSHLRRHDGMEGVCFAVWAPNARSVSVIGDFNGWDVNAHHLQPRGYSGIWEGFIGNVGKGTVYKYHVQSNTNDYRVDKADPYAIYAEVPPQTGSRVWDLDYQWNDGDWMRERHRKNNWKAPISVYEMHPGSWRRVPEEGNRSMSYRELAQPLADHLEHCGFTHVELMPVMEHPFGGSWGYQTTGYFAPTSRFGTPQDFMYLVDYLHQRGLGVILDWVPSHFPTDEHGLGYFDGSHLYEHADPRQGLHRDWGSLIFNYDRHEVKSFLLSSAMYWLDKYHADGLRVDAVASMLYLDYSRSHGEWIPNKYGGRENLGAIDFLRQMNAAIYERHPDVQTYAEESTAWPGVARPTYLGGLGFGFKWDMGWMHDTLRYFSKDPLYRTYHHGDLTFRMIYAFTENFILPLSHDEVVHGKGSLIGKMPGDDWRKFANLRLLYGYMFSQPAKKMLFMGAEFAQWSEWNHDSSLDWHLCALPQHRQMMDWVRDINRLYQAEPALHEFDVEAQGFEWIDANDSAHCVVSYLRKSQADADHPVLIVLNFTPAPQQSYLVGVPYEGWWDEILNSDAKIYGGSGHGNLGGVETVPVHAHGRPAGIPISLPPLGAVFFKYRGPSE